MTEPQSNADPGRSSPSSNLPFQGLRRWRLGLAVAALLGAAGVTVWSLQAAAGASEFWPLLLVGAAVSWVLPLLLLGQVSLLIAKGLGQPARGETPRAPGRTVLLLLPAVVMAVIAFAAARFAVGSTLVAAAKVGRPASAMLLHAGLYLLLWVAAPALLVLLAWRAARTAASTLIFALAQDVLVLVIAVPLAIALSRNASAPLRIPVLLPGLWTWVGLALVFGAEAAYLLRARWQWRPAWPAFALLAAGLLLVATLVPARVESRKGQDMQPLLAYARTHWVQTPPDAVISMVGPCRPGPHPHPISLLGKHTMLWISAQHMADGRWRCDRGREGAGYGLGTFFLRAEPLAHVASAEDARRLLSQCGVVDPDLSFAGVSQDRYRSLYTFRSPLGQGVYRVNDFGHINFFLDRPVEIPPANPGP